MTANQLRKRWINTPSRRCDIVYDAPKMPFKHLKTILGFRKLI